MRLKLAGAILPLTWILFTGSAHAEMSVAYTGDVDLPVTLYTGDGIQLEKGRYEIEIRSEKGLNFLAFLRKGELVSLVNGQPIGAQVKANKLPDQPMVGTVYLYAPRAQQDAEKVEKPSVTFAEHLRNRPWRAALRVYNYSDPQNLEVDFILEEKNASGEWSRTDFKLFVKK
jgi:hypothetical protein